MFTKLFIWSFLQIGMFCYILPIGIEASHKMKQQSKTGLEYFAVAIDNSWGNNSHAEFQELLRPMLIPRVPGSPGNIVVQQYIINHFQRLNWAIEEDSFEEETPIGVRRFNNIIATHDPTKKEKLTLVCHFDSKYMRPENGQEFIGATDSAVPCAILMDVANKLDCHLSGKRTKAYEDYTVQMVFLDGEEAFHEWTDTDSLYGSRHLAERWSYAPDTIDPFRTRLESVHLFILLDLIGTTDVTFRNFFDKSTKYFQHLNKLEKQLKAGSMLFEKGVYPVQRGLEKTLFSNNRQHRFIEDDHRPFMKKREDLNVLHLISSPFPSVWHTMEDNEAALDYDVTMNFNRVFRLFVANYFWLSESSCGRQ